MSTPLIIGIDFDNTIVSYNEVCYELALEQGLIPKELAHTKNAVRDYLRQQGKEQRWTEFQGHLYGPGIVKALPFPGVLQFITECKRRKIKVYVISHKTKYPFLGPKHDLHDYAHRWLEKQGFSSNSDDQQTIFLELTQEEKINRIKNLGCSHFIDDLPEIFEHRLFPGDVGKILFNPQTKASVVSQNIIVSHHWNEIKNYFFPS